MIGTIVFMVVAVLFIVWLIWFASLNTAEMDRLNRKR